MAHHTWPYALDADAAPPHDADRLILWLGRRQWRTLLGGVLFGVPWMLSIALVPAAIGRAIDEGLVARDARALVLWAGVIMGLGLVSAVTTNGRHWFAVRNWLIASFRSAVVTDRAVRRAGPALTRRMPAGEVVTSFASDFWRMGNVFDITARLAGAIVSFVVVSVILLQGSVLLGVLMLVGGPVLLASLSLVMRPLQRRQQAQRHEAGLLTSLGADTVAGLRVLRGIGGEDAFLARYAEQSARVRQAGVRLSPRAGDARRRRGAPPRHLRRPRHRRRGTPRGRGRDHSGSARGLLRLHGVPHHADAHGDGVRRQAHPRAGSRPVGSQRSSPSSPTTRSPTSSPEWRSTTESPRARRWRGCSTTSPAEHPSSTPPRAWSSSPGGSRRS